MKVRLLATPISKVLGPRFAFAALKPQLQSHLDNAGRSGAGDSAKTARRDRRPGVIQIRMIQPVEEFRPVLQAPSFRNPEILVRGEVDVKGPWSTQDVSPRITERTQPGHRESIGGEP